MDRKFPIMHVIIRKWNAFLFKEPKVKTFGGTPYVPTMEKKIIRRFNAYKQKKVITKTKITNGKNLFSLREISAQM
jgi:hypothetical protein